MKELRHAAFSASTGTTLLTVVYVHFLHDLGFCASRTLMQITRVAFVEFVRQFPATVTFGAKMICAGAFNGIVLHFPQGSGRMSDVLKLENEKCFVVVSARAT